LTPYNTPYVQTRIVQKYRFATDLTQGGTP
jgi:hypothetical protein